MQVGRAVVNSTPHSSHMARTEDLRPRLLGVFNDLEAMVMTTDKKTRAKGRRREAWWQLRYLPCTYYCRRIPSTEALE